MPDNRELRARIAQDTLYILQTGSYRHTNGQTVMLQPTLNHAIAGTRLYKPADFATISQERDRRLRDKPVMTTRFETTAETTLACAYRLRVQEQQEHVCALNFASAKNPGGGFQSGSQAQEESLARSSALYACLAPQQEMYRANQAARTSLYTDHMLYSPAVPAFRDDSGTLLPNFYTIDILTASAVNKGAIQQNEPGKLNQIATVMQARTEKLLSLAAVQGVHTLILGAWGCGVFKNEPQEVAQYFARLLLDKGTFAHAFERVIFAIPDHSPSQSTLKAFARYFAR